MEIIKYIKLSDVNNLRGRDLAKHTILNLINQGVLKVYEMEDKQNE